jgi:hypothetical protein
MAFEINSQTWNLSLIKPPTYQLQVAFFFFFKKYFAFSLFSFLKIIFVAITFISTFNTQTLHIKSLYTQQHCYVFLKYLIPWWDPNPGLLNRVADATSTAPRRQGSCFLL